MTFPGELRELLVYSHFSGAVICHILSRPY